MSDRNAILSTVARKLFFALLAIVSILLEAHASSPANRQVRIAPVSLEIDAALYTNGTYGDLYKLKFPGSDGVELEIVSFLSPMGKVSGTYFANTEVVRALVDALETHRFRSLPKAIAGTEPRPIHAPEYRLQITLDGKPHTVRLYAPEFKTQTEEAKRFVAVWNAVFDLVPTNVRPHPIRFKKSQ